MFPDWGFIDLPSRHVLPTWTLKYLIACDPTARVQMKNCFLVVGSMLQQDRMHETAGMGDFHHFCDDVGMKDDEIPKAQWKEPGKFIGNLNVNKTN